LFDRTIAYFHSKIADGRYQIDMFGRSYLILAMPFHGRRVSSNYTDPARSTALLLGKRHAAIPE